MKWLDRGIETLDRWCALRELRSVAKREAHYDRQNFDSLISEARDTFERGLRARAEEIWSRAKALYPQLIITSEAALELLLKLETADEAHALLTAAQRRYPRHAPLIEAIALLALQMRKYEEAVRYCRLLQRRHPSRTKSYWIAAYSLSELGRGLEAEAALSLGIRCAPTNVGLRVDHARLPEYSQNWSEALRRWTSVWEDHRNPQGLFGSINALKKLNRYDDIEQILADAMYKLGLNHELLMEFAGIAEHKQNWVEASLRWSTLRRSFPLLPQGYVNGLRPLLQLGDQAQAEEVLREGIKKIPDDPTLFVEYALLAHRRADWAEAALRWAEVRDRFPARREGYQRGADALLALGKTEEADAIQSMMPPPTVTNQKASTVNHENTALE